MSSIFNSRYIIIACLLSVIGFFLFFKLGAIPLCDPDEPRYAQSAREMNERGSYLVPYFNHEPRLNKPVAYYWLICISYKLFGVSEFSARLGSVLAALVLLGATFFFVSRVRDIITAFLSCVILGSSPLFFVPARLSMPDMVFSTLMILSLYCFYLGWQEQAAKQKNFWYWGFYLFQVIAAWTKGPVGILIPLAVAVLSLVREKDRQELRNLRLGWGLPLVLLASIPWYFYIFFFVNSAAMAEMSTSETISRIIGSQGRNYEPLYYYVPALIGGLFPWIFFLPWALHKRFKKIEQSRPGYFMETWFFFVLVFFTLCASKKFQYIICLSSVFSIWLGSLCAEAFRLRERKKDAGLIATLFILFLIVLVGCFTGLSWVSKKEPSLIMGGCMVFFTLMVPLGISLWLSVWNHKKTAVVALSFVSLLTLMPFLTYGMEWLGPKRSLKWLIEENKQLIAKVDTIYCAVKVFNSLVFYSPKPVRTDVDIDVLVQKLNSAEPCMGFLSEKKFEHFYEDLSPFMAVVTEGKVILSNIHK